MVYVGQQEERVEKPEEKSSLKLSVLTGLYDAY